jgi:hypothetical protein
MGNILFDDSVILAEILAFGKQETGVVIHPFQTGKVSARS